MKLKRRWKQLRQIVELHNEAIRLGGGLSANQRRFLDVACAYGKELEPAGLMAGKRA